MKLKEITVYQYSIETQSLFIKKREGLLLHLKTSSQEIWTEAAPLPQWSEESLSDVKNQLETHLPTLLNLTWSESSLKSHLKKMALYPSLASALFFGIDTLLTNPSKDSPEKLSSIKLHALLKGSSKEILSQAEQREKEGFTHVKVKISSLPVNEIAPLLKELQRRFTLRIDANRAHEVEESLAALSEIDFDYVEEPLKDPYELFKLPFPLALDETAREPEKKELLDLPTCKAVIYKPTLHGPYPIENKRLILSSSFETGVGITHIARFAQKINCSPAGLDTLRYLTSDLLETPLEIKGGEIRFLPSPIPKRNLLTKLFSESAGIRCK